MNSRHTLRGMLVLLAILAAAPLAAQLQTGNLYGTVTDQSGSALPGVTVTLSGQGAPQVQVSNAQGQFRFLSLAPGSYDLRGELEGFSTVDYPSIVINVGRNTSIELKLQSAVEETITVTAESPLLDERRISTGATVAKTELEKIPTARDPWVILQTTPGVLTDRINVGGNQSGQQSTYVGPGSPGTQAVWAVDGVVITDMGALGASPTYYDFDAFEEMQVSTGGSDATLATPGVALNMVTKRGTNEWRGSGRYYKADQSWQANGNLDEADLGGAFGNTPAQPSFKQGNRIVDVKDYGAELGGPIVKDRLWIWGAYAENKIDLLTISDVSDKTTLKDKNGKLNAQIAASNSATGFYSNGNKIKLGRGAGPTRPQPTTWDQDGPTNIYKVEDTQIFGSNFYLTGMYSYAKNVFNLVPEGGAALGVQQVDSALDENFVWQNTYFLYQTARPSHQYKADTSAFFNTGHLAHELKFGAGYRQVDVTSHTRWPGVGLEYNIYTPYLAFGYSNVIALSRESNAKYRYTYKNLYVQDTLTAGNLTANIGVRYDDQTPKNLASSIGANPVVPNLLPAVSFAGNDPGFEWRSITPRLGLTYALGADRKTLLRASYSRFADQLGGTTAVLVNPAYGFSYAYFFYTDLNHDGHFEPNEIGGPAGAQWGANFSGNVNPFTGGLLTANAVSSHLTAPITNEVLASAEYAVLPELVVGLDLTWRRLTGFVNQQRLVFDGSPYSPANIGSVGRVNVPSDYVPTFHDVTMPDGSVRSVPVAVLAPGIETRNGYYYYNSDVEQSYKGASVTLNKRLANRWMMRGSVTYSDWTWDIPQSEIIDPTLGLGSGIDGEPVVQGTPTGGGSFGNVFINSKWSYSLNGLYQVAPDRPWGFNVAGNLNGRQGYPLIYWARYNRGQITPTADDTVQITQTDEFRNHNVHTVDARVEKEFNFSQVGLTLGVDCFNLFNEGTVLQRNGRLGRANSNYVTEILSPRIFRLGARLSFH